MFSLLVDSGGRGGDFLIQNPLLELVVLKQIIIYTFISIHDYIPKVEGDKYKTPDITLETYGTESAVDGQSGVSQ